MDLLLLWEFSISYLYISLFAGELFISYLYFFLLRLVWNLRPNCITAGHSLDTSQHKTEGPPRATFPCPPSTPILLFLSFTWKL